MRHPSGAGRTLYPVAGAWPVTSSDTSPPGTALPGGAAALDVCLNGRRDYVQGTQMVARSADHFAAAGAGPVVLSAAAFHRITDREVGIVTGTPGPDLAEHALGTLRFTGADGAPLDAVLVAGPGAAPRRDIPVTATWEEIAGTRTNALSTAFALGGLARGEDFLVALVQTVKGLHEALADDVRDVWLTGLRGARIPLSGPFPVPRGRLDLEFRRLMPGTGTRQSLLMAAFSGEDGTPVARTAVTFSFRTEAPVHVD